MKTPLAIIFVTFLHLSLFSARPNIVLILVDDMGYGDLGCYGHPKAKTPVIDRLAQEGARFTQHYANGPECSPTRTALLTGRYQQRFGYDNNLPPGTKNGLELTETFGAKRLQKIGYKTGLIGKWHLGYPEAYHPNKRGFDWFYGLLQGSRPYFSQEKISDHRVIQENGKNTKEGGYVTDRFGDAACRFIKEHKEEPFYLFVSFTSPHGPLQPKPEDAARTAHARVRAVDASDFRLLAERYAARLSRRVLSVHADAGFREASSDRAS